MGDRTDRQDTEPAEPGEPGEGRRTGTPGGRAVTVLLLLPSLGFLAWAALPLLGLDTVRHTAALVALAPYAVVAGALLTLLGLLLRRWLTTLVVALVTAVLAFSVAPRALADRPVPVQGTPVTVMAANLYFGEAQPGRIVELVRRYDVDVLNLLELTPRAVDALDRAGLAGLLPYRVFHVRPGADGSGIASRFPLRELSLMPPTTMEQPSARVDLPGARDMEVVAVHPVVPVDRGTTDVWWRELTAMPAPARGGGPVRVLAGDFNATLDHTPMQALLGRGYADAAEVTGDGLRPTWPVGRPMPPVTIDHVLTSGGVVTQGYRTFEVAGSDHRAVLAHLVVPG